MNTYTKIRRDKGYAILFTVVVVSIISMITIGLSNAAYKQLILSSVARDSTTAFYQADIASECALFFDNEQDASTRPDVVAFTCAETSLVFNKIADGSYTITPPNGNSKDKCFRININKAITESLTSTEVEAMGYNICDKNSFRTVERSLKVTY